MTRETVCQCRVARLRNGEPEIITEACELHGPGLPADALLSSFPLKRDEDKWCEYEANAETMLRPREIFTHYTIDTEDVELLYGRRHGRR